MNDLLSRHFEAQAKACDALGSPFTARLCRALIGILDTSTGTGGRVLGWPGDAAADALSLRLCGGLHGLVLGGDDPDLAAVYPPNDVGDAALARAIAGAIGTHDTKLLAVLDSPPQTNEIARSAMLLPGFLTIARETGLPLALREIGSSAGLNLNFDRFHYRYGEKQWGDPGSPVRLAPDVRGSAPPLDGALSIVSRIGCDIAPVDLTLPASRSRLRSYIWADQTARLARLDAAMSVAQAFPNRVETAGAADFVGEGLAGRSPSQAFVLFHSIMWQYMPDTTRSAIETALHDAGHQATDLSPLAWLRMEPLDRQSRHATLTLTSWPDGATRHLAHCDYHGRWIEWL